jgi:hypothetical protein
MVQRDAPWCNGATASRRQFRLRRARNPFETLWLAKSGEGGAVITTVGMEGTRLHRPTQDFGPAPCDERRVARQRGSLSQSAHPPASSVLLQDRGRTGMLNKNSVPGSKRRNCRSACSWTVNAFTSRIPKRLLDFMSKSDGTPTP